MNARKGLALVIANSNYVNCSPIESCLKDGKDIALALDKLEFDVITAFDQDRSNIYNTISRCLNDAEKYTVFLFYYSGHGIQIDGKNYIVPIDYHYIPNKEVLINTVLVDLNVITAYADAHSDNTNIIILDACRSAPKFTKDVLSPGLAELRAGSGTFIAFATAPNSSAQGSSDPHENSVFTKHLIKHIDKVNVRIEDLFKLVRRDVEKETDGDQNPWESTSLKSDFFFNTLTESALNEHIYQSLRGHCDVHIIMALSESLQMPITHILRVFEKQKAAKPGGIMLNDDDIEIIVLRKVLESGFLYRNHRWFFDGQVVLMGEFLHDPNNIDINPENGKGIEISVDFILDRYLGKYARVSGRINLPENTKVSVDLEGKDVKYRASSSVTLNSNSEFCSDVFMYGKGQEAIPKGRYTLSISTPLASLQPALVQQKIGMRGRNLTGNNVVVDFFEKRVLFKTEITID